jgi:arginine:pyruvate transaminase
MPQSFAPLTQAISGRGADAWETHFEAMRARDAGQDVLILSVGDPDFDTPQPIIDAAVAAVRAGDTHYTEIAGRPALRAAIATRHVARTGEAVAEANVMITSGAQNALYTAISCLLGPDDHAIVLEPAYATYPATLAVTGCAVSYVPSPGASGFRLDAAALAAAVRPNTRLILFANPNNPTGVVLTREELGTIAALAAAHDLWIVADEVYGDLAFDGGFVPMAAIPAARGRTISVGSLSKSHAMTGWRCGWFVGPVALAEHAQRLALAKLYGLPGFVQAAGVVALTDCADVPRQMTALYRGRRDLVLRALAAVPGLAPVPPQAGMFVMVDVRGTGMTGAAFTRALYQETGACVLDGAAFGDLAQDYVRVSLAASEADLREGCRRMADFVRAHTPGRVAEAV